MPLQTSNPLKKSQSPIEIIEIDDEEEVRLVDSDKEVSEGVTESVETMFTLGKEKADDDAYSEFKRICWHIFNIDYALLQSNVNKMRREIVKGDLELKRKILESLKDYQKNELKKILCLNNVDRRLCGNIASFMIYLLEVWRIERTLNLLELW